MKKALFGSMDRVLITTDMKILLRLKTTKEATLLNHYKLYDGTTIKLISVQFQVRRPVELLLSGHRCRPELFHRILRRLLAFF